MKLDPFQPILRPHGFLRPLHCLLFLLSLSLLNTFSPFDTSRSPPLSTPIRTNGSLFLTVRQPEANAKARERNASPPTRRSLPENGNNEGGERGGPFWYDLRDRKGGTVARSRVGGAIVSRFHYWILSFSRIVDERRLFLLLSRTVFPLNSWNLSWNRSASLR